MTETWDSVWRGADLATMQAGSADGFGAIHNGALALKDGRIAWIGPADALPKDGIGRETAVHDVGGGWITPGLIDCHTHLVYGGDRAHEFELRLNGASYEEIARAGGGIRATVTATRTADEATLLAQGEKRLRPLLAEGVTTLEIKSGYGLDLENELKTLRVARRLGETYPLRVRSTLLAAHALPPEYAGDADGYIDLVCEKIIPAAKQAGLADAVDAFCETIGFTLAQTRRVFEAARKHGLPVKLHAEQLSNMNGAALAASFRALSADHLEYLDEAGVQAMAQAGTVAVLLPGAFYILRETKLPPIDLLRRHGVPIAISTDCNPGTSPVTSLLLMLSMACTLFHLTPAEALAGVTHEAARALGMADSVGSLETGKMADFVVWDIERPAALAYQVGLNPIRQVVFAGRPVAACPPR
ncbi:MAG: imidazolonepropionase [Ferrovibrio sp.]|uniref:imidazolonepropionase n=1 Tax=Ferrovibrio sp. TaxID=1917215 RepID=UPI0026090FD8|nr:imidazolonepropionase [Ferrovibrio sp.]MCW0233425.1 imidazolonepropionase [Ferrovibrio sp.]